MPTHWTEPEASIIPKQPARSTIKKIVEFSGIGVIRKFISLSDGCLKADVVDVRFDLADLKNVGDVHIGIKGNPPPKHIPNTQFQTTISASEKLKVFIDRKKETGKTNVLFLIVVYHNENSTPEMIIS